MTPEPGAKMSMANGMSRSILLRRAAAAICQGFCRSELDAFRRILGPGCRVERTDHILAGARRCAYRITEVEAAAA